MAIISDKDKEYIKKLFSEKLDKEVRILMFTQKESPLVVPGVEECTYCKETRQILEELCELSPKLKLEVHDFYGEKELAAKHGVDKIPATLLIPEGEETARVRFYGIPSGYEFGSLIEDIIDMSRGETSLSPESKQKLASLTSDIHIQVFVTPTCPYCPSAVRTAHQMAMESKHIKADMIEAIEFPHLANRYRVRGVPKTIANDIVEIEGALPEQMFVERVLSAVKK
ncbi:thioredoxin family protein [bacterium]|nr:thioredoxin family protein [bacterium]